MESFPECIALKSKVAGAGIVEIGIKFLEGSYQIFVYANDRQYTGEGLR